jgi:hypothetical protein
MASKPIWQQGPAGEGPFFGKYASEKKQGEYWEKKKVGNFFSTV